MFSRSRARPRAALAFVAALALCVSAPACVPADYPLGTVAPAGMSDEAWAHGVAAWEHAAAVGLTRSSLLTIIDFSRPATERRLWVFDVSTGQILAHEYVAHAVRSGGRWATAFSNDVGSYQSSLGTFLTANSYYGIRGLSLRLRGLEPGINDNAMRRGIVLHGTPGVSALRAQQGRQGRTEGCPAVPAASAPRLVRLLEGGTVVFAWYPDRDFLARSAFVDPGRAALRLSASD